MTISLLMEVQRYDESDWKALVALWAAYNRHLSDVVARLPEAAKGSPCNIGKAEPATLEFVVKDYLRHLKHHLGQLLGEGV